MRLGKLGPAGVAAAAIALALVAAATARGEIPPSPYWKNTIQFPNEPFANTPYEQPRWVKFTILLSDPQTVYFQDSVHYPFHYDFAVAELPPFFGMSPSEFDAVTLHESGQQAVLGAVLIPGLPDLPEYGIQLVRQDPYTPQQVVDLFHVVASRVVADPGVQAFYFPTYEQLATALANEAWLEAQGVPVDSAHRWSEDNGCYSGGWALGRLKFFPASEISDAFLAGALLPEDILLTDGVPAEVPFVAGIVSLAPSAPNSHVAILADTFDVPFVYLSVARDAQRAQELVGHRIALRVAIGYGGCRTRLIDVEGVLDDPTIDEILQLKQPPVLGISPIESYGAYSAPTDALVLEDIRYFGGKASQFGFLRRAIPNDSPVAGALSFDLWTAFLDQPLAGGGTLRGWIASRLAGFGYPPDIGALSTALEQIRDKIQDDDETHFAPVLESAVLGMLQSPLYGFDPLRKIRFRSSTNVEDAEHFIGAGLYDSYSGCLADDLDGDGEGPSLCDPLEPKERGVFRAIRKVFASFYNLNAFLERLRHGIDEDDVGMAVLVHHSFPDEIELANGVGLLDWSPGSHKQAYLVSQAGASPVTHPEPGAIPEEVQVNVYSFGTYADILQYSNLVQLGATVLEFDEEYVELTDLLVAVGERYELETGLTGFILEFEYKKVAPDGDLVVKQVRRLPEADDAPSVTPFLIEQPVEYCIFQGEFGDALANHRLKSRWRLRTRSMWLTPENLAEGLYAHVDLEYTESCLVLEQSGPPADWPQARHEFTGSEVIDTWVFDFLQNPRTYRLTTSNLWTSLPPSSSPLLVLEDFYCLELEVDYGTPVPSIDYQGQQTTTATDSVSVCLCPEEQIRDQLQQRVLSDPGVEIDTRFYWPPHPSGATAGYTAPLSRFVETSIAGWTAEPVVLRSGYSQTYRPGHHNFSETFVFEPAREAGISPQQLDELAAAGVRVVRVDTYDGMTIFDDAAWGEACLGCLGDDLDEDGWCVSHGVTLDCDDGDPDVWTVPGEVTGLRFPDPVTLTWTAPAEPGALEPRYDTLSAPSPSDFVGGGACVEWDDGSDTLASVTAEPGPGAVFFYLVRAENDCPQGQGGLGHGSSGIERQGVDCP